MAFANERRKCKTVKRCLFRWENSQNAQERSLIPKFDAELSSAEINSNRYERYVCTVGERHGNLFQIRSTQSLELLSW
jgi:hypothetical protein